MSAAEAPPDATPDAPPLLIEPRGAVTWLTMIRPARLNALDHALVQALRDYFQGLVRAPAADTATRVVVLQGAGRAYCAGLDLKDRAGLAPRDVDHSLDGQAAIRDIMVAMRECPQPVISIVQGAAAGGGFGLALASDIRLATPDARFNAAFIKLGLSACDMGVSYFLPRMVGASVAAELMLTGRFLTAPRALALGFVSMVDALPALQAEAAQLAAEMLATTPLGLRLTKDAMNHNLDAPGLRAAIALEDRNQILCTRGPDFAEGIRAFLDKRTPVYGPR